MDYNKYDNDLIKKIRENDHKAYDELYKKYYDIISKFVIHKKLAFDIDDAIQDGCMLFLKCIKTYKFDSTVSFYTYFLLCFKRLLAHQLETSDYSTNNCLRFNEELYYVNNYNSDFSKECDIIEKKVLCLNDFEKNVFNDFFICNLSAKVISEKYNMDISKIYRTIYRIRSSIKNEFDTCYYSVN